MTFRNRSSSRPFFTNDSKFRYGQSSPISGLRWSVLILRKKRASSAYLVACGRMWCFFRMAGLWC